LDENEAQIRMDTPQRQDVMESEDWEAEVRELLGDSPKEESGTHKRKDPPAEAIEEEDEGQILIIEESDDEFAEEEVKEVQEVKEPRGGYPCFTCYEFGHIADQCSFKDPDLKTEEFRQMRNKKKKEFFNSKPAMKRNQRERRKSNYARNLAKKQRHH
jgi:hypothetical protein